MEAVGAKEADIVGGRLRELIRIYEGLVAVEIATYPQGRASHRSTGGEGGCSRIRGDNFYFQNSGCKEKWIYR